jgi:hypothetical protein
LNLRKLTGGVVFFDEAEALFGCHIEVRYAEVRYANLEINYFCSVSGAAAG